MAYRRPVVSPSALAATELCPRFRPDGKDNDAAAEGTMLHECLEHMIEVPPEQWDSWITTRELNEEHKGLLNEAATQLRTIIEPGMQTFTDKKLKPRYRLGKEIRQRLKPGLYPELEVETAPGRHGYIDLLVMLSSGIAVVVDYKFERQGKIHDLQLAKYCICLKRYLPDVTGFEARIIAPRIQGDEIEKYLWADTDLAEYALRIDTIEELADRSANDFSIAGCPSQACQYCHSNGRCPYQAGGVMEVANTMNVVSDIMVPNGPFAGEVLSRDTFTRPATLAQRGLRRACIAFLEASIKTWKDDDKQWSSERYDDTKRSYAVDVPGWTLSWNKGKSTLDRTRESEIHQTVMAELNMPLEDVLMLCELNESKLVEDVVTHFGLTDKEAKERVAKMLDRFKVRGAGYPVWRQKGKPRKSAGTAGAVTVV